MSKLLETREQEWQFAASGLDAVREWIARQPAEYSVRRFAPRATLELQDTYFDSADWKIFSAGFALRLRSSRDDTGAETCELTLKTLRAARDGFADRAEISEPVASTDLAAALSGHSALAERIRALIGARALAPLFSAHTRRERQQLLEADTELPLAEVDLDLTSLRTPSGERREFTRVEVECLNADRAVLEPLVEQLRAAAHLEPANESKFRAGLSAAGLNPVSGWSPPPRAITAAMPFDTAVLAVLGRYFAATLHAEPRVRLGVPDAVHEMRVAARHLDVLLKALTNYAPTWAVRSRRVVRALIKALGAVRDCDVQLAYLAGPGAAGSAAAVDALRAHLESDRGAARRELLELLDAADVREWIEGWRREIDVGNHASTAARQTATGAAARDLVLAQARKLRKRADDIGAHSSPDDYHEVRIRAKRLRYVLDAFADLYGAASKDFTEALAKLQTVLGDHHDAIVRAARFTTIGSTLAGGALPAAASFAMGRLVERDARAIDECHRKFPKAYRRVRRRRWRTLQDAMERAAAEA